MARFKELSKKSIVHPYETNRGWATTAADRKAKHQARLANDLNAR